MSSPSRLKLHFCRECGARFETDTSSKGSIAPHAAVWRHIHQEHRDYKDTFLPCTRYCAEAAQPEEELAGRRLYGKGVVTPFLVPSELKRKLDLLFPPED